MFKKISFVILGILFLGGIAFCGQIQKFVCAKCGFKSSELFTGQGKSGIKKSIIYCPKCRDFYTIATSTNSVGKKRFMGKERLVYACPKCASEAFAYAGPVCPLCKKAKLKIENTGDWD